MAYTPGVGRVSLAIARAPRGRTAPDHQGQLGGRRHRRLRGARPGQHRARRRRCPSWRARRPCSSGSPTSTRGRSASTRQDVDEIVAHRRAASHPGSAASTSRTSPPPRCFEIERRLASALDIPVFHDDQHGTAIVVLAALTNALRVVDKALPDARIVVSGAGAAGSAIVHLLLAAGADDVTVYDRDRPAQPRGRPAHARVALAGREDQPARLSGALRDGLQGADVFIGVAAPGILDPDVDRRDGRASIVFALANPDPEVDIREATQARHGRGIGSQRLPEPDQQRARIPGRVPRLARRQGTRS